MVFTGIIPQIIKRRHLSTELEIVSEEKLCYFLYIFFTGSSVGDFPKYNINISNGIKMQEVK